MYEIFLSSEFKLSKNDLNLVGEILDRLASGEKLEPKHKDHPLVGNFKGCRECHIKPDLLLVYKKSMKF